MQSVPRPAFVTLRKCTGPRAPTSTGVKNDTRRSDSHPDRRFADPQAQRDRLEDVTFQGGPAETSLVGPHRPPARCFIFSSQSTRRSFTMPGRGSHGSALIARAVASSSLNSALAFVLWLWPSRQCLVQCPALLQPLRQIGQGHDRAGCRDRVPMLPQDQEYLDPVFPSDFRTWKPKRRRAAVSGRGIRRHWRCG